MIAVANHAMKALEYENIGNDDKIVVELAALLHDADDEKIFPGNNNYENARKILAETLPNDLNCLTEKNYWSYIISFML